MTLLTPLAFQRRFLRGAFAPGIDTAALSLPRGNGKTHLAGYILARCLTPGDAWHQPGAEYLLCAASIEQARLCFRPIRAFLESEHPGRFRFIDSVTRIGIVDKTDNTRLRVLSSNGKTGMGIVGCPLLVADEPGSWETVGGELMATAIMGALGKPESPMRAIFIGTLAPATAGWWHDLVKGGSHGSVYVQALQGDAERWDVASEIRRCNPLMWRYAASRRKLLEERDAARADSRLRANFQSYRLNVPTGDETTMLLTTADWLRVLARPTQPRDGAPVVGIDMGGNRAWSSAVAAWRTGRVEAIAIAPGIPSLEDQEKRDRTPRGTYQRLFDAGTLRVADGLRIPPATMLLDAVAERWGNPLFFVGDRFRAPDLHDAMPGIQLDARVTRWSEASADIRALRRACLDGNLSVDGDSAGLLTASLSVAMVQSDGSGNVRMVKKGTNNTSRDDVAAALVLVAGAVDRWKPFAEDATPAYSGLVPL